MSAERREAHELLRTMYGLLRRGWCQRASAKDAGGFCVSPYSPDACRWCFTGAWRAATHLHEPTVRVEEEAVRALEHATPTASSWPTWNDGPDMTQQEALRAVGRALWNVDIP